MPRVLRTPDARFDALPDFPYEPRYADVGGLRMAYVDEGPRDARPVLLLHGEPTWSFLYRRMIPPLVAAGHRVVAPDFIGFGRSDKLADPDEYTYAAHLAWTAALLEHLDVRDVTLFCQDWGGLIGLRLAVEHEHRFAAICASNTGLPTGDQAMPDVWLRFREVVRRAPDLSVSQLVRAGCVRDVAPDVLAAYDAPFPDDSYLAGVRRFPELVPAEPDNVESENNRRAWQALTRWTKPFLCAFSDSDPITGAMAPILQRVVPGAQGQPHTTIERAGHFVQEDAGNDCAHVLLRFLGDIV